jgi:mxaA protein
VKRHPGRASRLVTLSIVLLAAHVAANAQFAPAPSESTDAARAAAAPPNAVVQQPRSFGHVIGDVVTQRVLLEVNARAFVPATLPSAGPAGVWLERRAARIEGDSQGRRWLALDYQLMNSPQALTVVTLPPLKLSSTNGNAELRVGEWSMSLAPLTPRQPFARVGLGSLRPDRGAPFIDVTSTTRWFVFWLAAAIALSVAWLAWWMWRNWQASSRLPFGVALRELRGINETEPRAWHALHRAFDSTAGQVVRADALAVLFKRAPELATLRSPIERFYAQSAARFFGTDTPAEPLSLRQLCIDLRRIEKARET